MVSEAQVSDMGKRKEATLEVAIELLKEEYERAKSLEYVRNPLAFALYHTWKKIDKEEKGVNKQ